MSGMGIFVLFIQHPFSESGKEVLIIFLASTGKTYIKITQNGYCDVDGNYFYRKTKVSEITWQNGCYFLLPLQ